MNIIELTIPKLGESVSEVTLSKWLKQVGDFVNLDEIIAEVSTDKVDSDVPSTHAGKLIELKYEEGDTITIGKVFAVIDISDSNSTNQIKEDVLVDTTVSDIQVTSTSVKTDKFLSPLVKRIIKEENLNLVSDFRE